MTLMFAITLITTLALINQPQSTGTPVDSLQIGEFSIIKYSVESPAASSDVEYFQFDIVRGGKIIRSTIADPFIYIYKCLRMNGDCDFMDLNGDGSLDVIFVEHSGGTAGAENIFIYSLDSSATEIAAFEGMDKYLAFIKDIDNDGNMELFFHDLTDYGGYPEGTEIIPYYRVYKWDGTRFRIANFRLKNEISRLIFGQVPDSIDIRYFDKFKVPGNYEYKSRWTPEYPIGLGTTITSLYFIGEYASADSIFERCWPDSIPGKKEFIGYFKEGVHGEFDEEILESDWK
jgi:hypothetical protein